MKIQVVRIEPYDNLSSLLDKINLADASRVVLEDSGSFPWLSEEMVLKKLLRKSIYSGKQIGLITSNAQTRSSCQGLKIQVFEDLSAASDDQWKNNSTGIFKRKKRAEIDRRLTKPISIPENEIPQPVKMILVGFFIIVLVCIMVLILPSSQIKLNVTRTRETVSIPVEISSIFSQSTISGNIPAEVHSETISIVKTNPVTKTALIPVDYAKGNVVFTNMTDLSQIISVGTIVSTGGDRSVDYLTTAEAILEGKVGAEVKVPVKARIAGEVGNADIGTIQQIKSLQGTQLKVRNDLPLTGGISRQVSSPDAVDRNTIRAEVLTAIRQKAIGQYKKSLDQDQLLLEPSYRLEQILVEEYFPEIGKAGNTITLEMTVTTRIFSVSRNELANYLNQVYALSLSKDDEVAPVDKSALGVQCETGRDTDTYPCVISSAKETWRSIHDEEVYALLRGQAVVKAHSLIITRFPQVTSFDIDMKPNGWPWFPYLPSRFHVKVQ